LELSQKTIFEVIEYLFNQIDINIKDILKMEFMKGIEFLIFETEDIMSEIFMNEK
jgi:hypothetical protein